MKKFAQFNKNTDYRRRCKAILLLKERHSFSGTGYSRNTANLFCFAIGRLLPKPGLVWNRASPTLCIQDKEKDKKMKEINRALANANAENPFFLAEADT